MYKAPPRDISIDILKCIAAIMITNSHMDILYGDYSCGAQICAPLF